MRKFVIVDNSLGQGKWVKRCLVSFGLFVLSVVGKISSLVNFKGYYRFALWVTRFIPDDMYLDIQLDINSIFRIAARDPYWVRLVSKNYSYERSLETLLHSLKDLDYTFLDCGANFGYWSVMVSGSSLGSHYSIGVEPMPQPFYFLEMNRELNGFRYDSIQAAIYSDDNLTITMTSDVLNTISNAAAAISTDTPADQRCVTAKTITIDKIISDNNLEDHHLVIKLDIEGAEIAALEGTPQSALEKSLFIYEDHGRDQESNTSKYLLNNGFVLYYLEDEEFEKLNDIEDITKIKTNPKKGYNFFAYKPLSKFSQIIH